jgi:hypothetical protein
MDDVIPLSKQIPSLVFGPYVVVEQQINTLPVFIDHGMIFSSKHFLNNIGFAGYCMGQNWTVHIDGTYNITKDNWVLILIGTYSICIKKRGVSCPLFLILLNKV